MSEQDITSSSIVSGSVATQESGQDDDVAEDHIARQRLKLRSRIRREHRLASNNPTPTASEAVLMRRYTDRVASGAHFEVPDLSDEAGALGMASDLVADLTRENRQIEELIADMEKQITVLDEQNDQQDEQIKTLKEITEKRITVGDMKQDTKLEVKLKKAKQLFASFKVVVEDLVSECFDDRDDDIKEILQDLCSAFFEGSNLYTDVSENDNEIIALLVDANIIVRHKQDTTLVRLNTAF